jgi:hypothetical protein
MATPNTPFTTPGEPSGGDDGLLATRKLDTICLFDVDGTITMARQVFTKIYF